MGKDIILFKQYCVDKHISPILRDTAIMVSIEFNDIDDFDSDQIRTAYRFVIKVMRNLRHKEEPPMEWLWCKI
jgi:hypothetical protein